MEIEIKDFIGVFDNVVTDKYCDSLIEHFENMQNIGKISSRVEAEDILPTEKDNSVYFYISETDPLILNDRAKQLQPFIRALEGCYGLYAKKYGMIQDLGRHAVNPDIKLQKTLPGEGYHVWHCEVMDIPSARRFLLCMLYLNDVKDGGETEFLYQHKRIQPVKGRVVICPTAFTHTHRGNPPLNTAKYMINGWMEFLTL